MRILFEELEWHELSPGVRSRLQPYEVPVMEDEGGEFDHALDGPCYELLPLLEAK